MYEFFWMMVDTIVNTRHALKTDGDEIPEHIFLKKPTKYEILCENHIVERDTKEWIQFLKRVKEKKVFLKAGFKRSVLWNSANRVYPDCSIVTNLDETALCWEQYYNHEKDGWSLKYKLIIKDHKEDIYRQISIPDLCNAIEMNLEFSRKIKWDIITHRLQSALEILKKRSSEESQNIRYHLPNTYGQEAQTLYKALQLIDLFGGMGNWDDGGVPTELTDELYKQFIQGVLYCVNAGDEPGFSLRG